MTFKIDYYALDGNHITLNPSGTIEIWINGELITVEYKQAQMLKKMILVEHKLND